MKNKGISLIVLIITVVVIIILGTAIIVNIARTNIIENANEAVVKQDFKTFQDELNLYIADEFAKSQGSFNVETLNETVTSEIAGIIPSIAGTKYQKYVTIVNGKIAISDTMPEPEKTWAMEALGLISTSNNVPTEPEITDTTAPTEPTNLELTVTGNVITALASGSTDDNDFVYEYSIDNTNWQESGEIKNLEKETEYTVYARAKDEAGNISNTINESIETKYYTIVANKIVEGSNATIYGELPTYNNPVIPVGFKAVNTNEASWNDEDKDGVPDGWNNGLVIQDDDLNEFVWVPCSLDGANGTIKYTKNFTYPSYYSATSSNTSDDVESLPMKDETTRVDETEQVTKYGGFYIGRYEAGVPANQTAIDGTCGDGTYSKSDVDGIPVVKKDSTVWTYISYNKAIQNAKKLYENSTSVRSGIVRGTQWDAVCAWIESEKDSQGMIVHSVTNSKSWGNYSDTTGNARYDIDGITKISGEKQTAGKSEIWKAKNIYDLAGNTWEWIGEIYTSNSIRRGGNFNSSGSERPAACRLYNPPSGTYVSISFRVALYVM